jgi:hypothetical protein
MAIPGLVAASNLADTENKEAVWDNLGNGIDAVILATNFIRNNTMVGAVAGTPGTDPTLWEFVTAQSNGLVQSIVGTGIENGISYIDYRFNGTTVASPAAIVFGLDSAVATTGQTWTNSLYWKLAGGTATGVLSWLVGIIENDLGGLFVAGEFYPQSTPTPADLLLQRPAPSRILSGGDRVGRVQMALSINVSGSTAIDFTLRIGMPQMQQGGYLTPPIATTNAPASALATVPLSIKGDDILELVGARLAATSDFVRIKGLTTLAQPRLTTAAANTASGAALRDNALLKASPSSEGDYFLSRGTLDGQSLRVNGLNIASLSGSPFSGDTASCPLLISSFAAPTNLRINNAMASGTLAFPERAIPIETDQFIFYAKAGQS